MSVAIETSFIEDQPVELCLHWVQGRHLCEAPLLSLIRVLNALPPDN